MLLCLLLSTAIGYQRPAIGAEPTDEQLTFATRLFYSGSVKSSLSMLKAMADEQNNAPRSATRQQILEYLLDVCSEAWDYSCLNNYTTTYATVVTKRDDITPQVKRAFALRAAYYFGVSVWMTGQKPQATAWLKAVPESAGDELADIRYYIRRQLLRAKLYFIIEDRPNTELCVDRALMTIASAKEVGSSAMEMSSWLAEAVQILDALGQSERAFGLVQANSRFGQKIFPPHSLAFYWLLQRSAGAYQAVGFLQQAKENFDTAAEVLNTLDIDPSVEEALRAQTQSSVAIMCVLMNDTTCATQAIDKHPARERVEAIRDRGTLADANEVSYYAIRALIDAVQGLDTDPKDIAVLAHPFTPRYPVEKQIFERYDLYRRVAHALATTRSDGPAARSEFAAIAPDILRICLEQAPTIGPLPRLDPIDRLITQLAIISMSGSDLTSQKADALVQLFDLESRNATSFAGEALALLSSAKNDEVREKVRTVLRLRSRRDAAEREDIGRVLSLPTQDGSSKGIQLDISRRTMYSEYGLSAQKALAEVVSSQPTLQLAVLPPRLTAIQKTLSEHEVVVGAPVFYGGIMGHLCLRSNSVSFVNGVVNLQDLQIDQKLLNAALTAQYEPSPELDRQYPVGAARNLYGMLFGPIEPCLKRGDTIIWTGIAPRESPLASLLTTGTAESLRSQPLASWPWLVMSHDIIYVDSLATLLSLRSRLSPNTDRLQEYLGVGDPTLTGMTAGGQDRGALSVRGVVSAEGLAALPPLPDTRQELSDIGAIFPGRATLLLEGNATEAAFRRLPLGRYTYISFATHGLVRQDISGLDESALVLTPESASDTFDDGLLTASEIGDLPLSASFVALSACNTAVLDYTKYASELPTLSAAFQMAGVSSVLATLWPVESDASRRIVAATFRELVTRKSAPAHALGQGQREYLTHPPSPERSHPRFWSPFAVFGDAARATTNDRDTAPAQIGEVVSFSRSGGEIFSAFQHGTQSVIAHGMGDVGTINRHKSWTAKLGNDFKPVWAIEDGEIAATKALAELHDGRLILGGYRGGGQDSPVIASVRLLDTAGRLVKEWKVARPNADVYPMGIVSDPKDAKSAYVLLVQSSHFFGGSEPAKEDRVMIAKVGEGAELSIKADLGLGTADVLAFSSLNSLGHDLLVSVTDEFAPINAESYFDVYHELRGCLNAPKAKLLLIDTTTWHISWETELPSVDFTATGPGPSGTVLLLGSSRESCVQGKRMSLWEVSSANKVRNVYRDPSATESTGSGLVVESNASLMLFGDIKRVTDVASLEERDVTRLAHPSLISRVNYSTREADDALVVRLDARYRVTSTAIVRAGADIWTHGAVRSGNKLWLYGSLGGQAAFMRLEGE